MRPQPLPPLSYDQQVLLDNDFDNAQPHFVEEWLSKHREAEELDDLGY